MNDNETNNDELLLEILRKKHEDALLVAQAFGRDIDAVRARIVKRKYGVEIGSIVFAKGSEYKVLRLRYFSGKPWVYGQKKKKSGEFGNAEHALYEWWTLLQPSE